MEVCPECGSRAIGKVATNQYYCWDCCIEFAENQDSTIELYEVDLDGELVSMGQIERTPVTVQTEA